MCYSYAIGYNVGFTNGCYDDFLEKISDDFLDYFNTGYHRGCYDDVSNRIMMNLSDPLK